MIGLAEMGASGRVLLFVIGGGKMNISQFSLAVNKSKIEPSEMVSPTCLSTFGKGECVLCYRNKARRKRKDGGCHGDDLFRDRCITPLRDSFIPPFS